MCHALCRLRQFLSVLVHSLAPAQVARPRPDFAKRCWPKSRAPTFSDQPSGLPVCDARARDNKLRKGLRSFPSGEVPSQLCVGWSCNLCCRSLPI